MAKAEKQSAHHTPMENAEFRYLSSEILADAALAIFAVGDAFEKLSLVMEDIERRIGREKVRMVPQREIGR
jgi:hypothetical protein